jgi:peptidoglycan/xylan/chitin deacetylase (PgdA/CDA1 family)
MNGMKGGCRLLLLWLIDILGINALYRVVNRNKAIILWYHGVCDEGFKLTKRHIAKSVFRKQLSYLKRKGYIFITMSELLDVIKNKKKINKYAVLTFDDGFRNVVENAYPIMKEFGAKGCIYLVSDLIGTTQLLWTDHVETVIRSHKTGNFQFNFKGEEVNYRLDDDRSCEYAMEDIKAKLRTIPDSERHKHMEQFHEFTPDDFPQEFMMASWEQIRELDPEVLEAGSHTKRHPNCTNLTSDDEIKDEIYNSKIDIDTNRQRVLSTVLTTKIPMYID